jgi:SET domain-containing protein
MKLYRIKKSKIDNKGRGLYATKNIKEGTKIINYVGKIITNKQVEKSDKYNNDNT